jgi:hypothetical protein
MSQRPSPWRPPRAWRDPVSLRAQNGVMVNRPTYPPNRPAEQKPGERPAPRRVVIEDDPAPSYEAPPLDHEPEDLEDLEDLGDDGRTVEEEVAEVLDHYDEETGEGFADAYADLLDLGLSHDEALSRLGRPRDLAPAPTGPVVRSSRRASHARPEPRLLGPYHGLGDGEAVELGEADGPERLSAVHHHEDRSRERATSWLKENDPRYTAEGVAAEVHAALDAAGLAPEDVVTALPGKRGRPSAETMALRERVREVLSPLHEDGRNRDHMAHALGCGRRALERLMG